MSLWLILVISVTVSAGTLLLFSRELFRIIMGLAVLSMAVNLIVFLAGRPQTLVSPIIESASIALPSEAANPLSQALVLTAIVISFALLCFSLVLAAVAAHQRKTTDVSRFQDSEPQQNPSDSDNKPPIVEAE